MTTATTHRVDWTLIWAQRGFRYFFFAMFISLFGSGMNFAGVSWYILASTHSTVKVSWQVIVMTLPGLVVPFLGGVLIDRLDRRYLGVLLDLVRAFFVLGTAYIAWRGHLQLWHLYAMTLITGTGSAMYWATVNALVQEVIPPSQFTGANAAVLVGVQSGMLIAGAFVGFIYNTAGIQGILAIDGATACIECAKDTSRRGIARNIRASTAKPRKPPPKHWKPVRTRRSRKRAFRWRFTRT
jgi:MFS family permease